MSVKKLKYTDLWFIILGFSFVLTITYPFIDAYRLSNVDFNREIDPEYLNGLLTASSILLGFSSVLAISERPIEKLVWWVLVIPILLLFLSANTISAVALGKQTGVWALLWLNSTLNACILSTGIITGFRTATWLKKERKQ